MKLLRYFLITLILAALAVPANAGNAGGSGTYLPEAFTRNIAARIDKEPSEMISPFSLRRLLAILSLGASGTTRDQIAKLLGGEAPDSIASDDERVLGDVDRKLVVSDSVWIDRAFHVTPHFVSSARKMFGAQVQTVQFSDPRTMDEIGRWLARATNGEVALTPLHPNTKMVAIDALHYVGQWLIPFDPVKTKKEPFLTGHGSTRVFMMNGLQRVAEAPDGRTIAIPFSDRTKMFIRLVGSVMDSPSVLDAISASTTPMKATTVMLKLPRLTLKCHVDLVDALRRSGMDAAFSPQADFRSLFGVASVPLTDVYQDLYLKIGEHGAAVAAASTAVSSLSGAHEFAVNRPFSFAIVDTRTEAIIVAGVVTSI